MDEGAEKTMTAYEFQSRHFSMINDNFFKRVHVFMAAAEAATVAVAVGTITQAIGLKAHPREVFMLLAAFSLAGTILAMIWFILGTRQMQALELSKRYLRFLEQEAWGLGIPLGANTFEAFVSHPTTPIAGTPQRFGIALRPTDRAGVIWFGREKFPADDGAWRYRSWTVQAGVAPLETALSLGFALLWVGAAVVSALALFSHKERLTACGVIVCLVACVLLTVGLLLAPPQRGVLVAPRRTRDLLMPWRWTLKGLLLFAGFTAILCGTVFICLGIPFDWTYPP